MIFLVKNNNNNNLVHLVDGVNNAWIKLDMITGVNYLKGMSTYECWLEGGGNIQLTEKQYEDLLPHLEERKVKKYTEERRVVKKDN